MVKISIGGLRTAVFCLGEVYEEESIISTACAVDVLCPV